MTWDTFPQELMELADSLGKHTETQEVANALFSLFGAFDHSWRHNRTLQTGTGFRVPEPRNKGLHPKACTVTEAELSFVFELGPSIEESLIPARMDFQVCVRGRVEYGASMVELEDHWRVDTHPELGGEAPWEPHPKIHFQRGGHAQDAFVQRPGFLPSEELPAKQAGAWRSLLQSPGPRVPFPPACPVLAIDYVIGQHNGLVHRKLRETPEYQTVVERAQTRLWLPFFEKLAHSKDLRRLWLSGW